MAKKVLVIGQGGREHALVWKLAQSPEINKIFAVPGNPGIAGLAECVDIGAGEVDKLLEFALANKIDLTVVGPEAPLMEGLVDIFEENGLKAFGPSAAAARLEGSKVFTKNLLKKYGIPTADYEAFEDIDAAKRYARTYTAQGKAVVVKADGLAAGKGVVVAKNWDEASRAIDNMMRDRSFGKAGEKVVIEECLEGEEVSFFAISDGKNYLPLLAAQDHKQVFDNDEGPNTGGMGAYSNPPVYSPKLYQQVLDKIIGPVIEAMAKEGCPYKGVVYAGLMITREGPKVLEFNARFGDPETQVLMPMIKGDLFPLLEAACEGKLVGQAIELEEGACVCVVLASGGYPGDYEKGKLIEGLEKLDSDILVFHAGTIIDKGRLLSNGGRVLGVVSKANGIPAAIEKVFKEVEKISFDLMYYRKDIGKKALKREV